MAKSSSEDAFVCCACIEDEALRSIITSEGSPQECALCSKHDNAAVSLFELAHIMLPVIEEYYIKIADQYEQQLGQDLSWVIQDVLGGQELPCESGLIDALEHADYPDHHDPDSPFIDVTASYDNKPVTLYEQHEQWEDIKNTLKHKRRFFNDQAKEFFDWLFEDLEHLTAPPEVEAWPPPAHVPVVYELPAGTKVFRARICDTDEALKEFITTPAKELGPPAPSLAKPGRMNPDGIPVFYGALDEKTCGAELRPLIGRRVLIGAFETVAPIRSLDFRRLENAYWGKKQLSYFQPDASSQFQRREFLRTVHTLISEPVLPERENEYLLTQFIAEYLSHVRDPPVAALLFRSTQEKDGTNIVVFSKGSADPASEPAAALANRFCLKYVDNSASLLRATGVKYAWSEEKYFLTDDGDAKSYSLDEDL